MPEINISLDEKYTVLENQCSISTECLKKARLIWGETCLVIPEYAFAVELPNGAVELSHEHTEYEWVDYNTAVKKLKYDSNRVALWELDNKIKMNLI